MSTVLDLFTPATRTWFAESFAAPTAAQAEAWQAISRGDDALVIAPTGSGKTLAAFLWAIDRLAHDPDREPGAGTRVLYLSPLKALGVDVERNLRAPLVGIGRTAERIGQPLPAVSVGVRSGDTLPAARRALLTNPPEILITTPESLFLMLTSSARETLRHVDTVIIDEIHAIAATKRGSHLAVSLERLDALLPSPAQRIGLSATVRPPEAVARFLQASKPVAIVDPPSEKKFDLRVVVPLSDMTDLSESAGSIWPRVEEAILDEVLAHRSSIVFANSRRLAERLTARLNELYAERVGVLEPANAVPAAMLGGAGQTSGAEPLLARAHHGSVSKEERADIEADLKSGSLRCVVATSSLELGIDMGAVDLVVQVESPPSVASGLQRLGRAGHQVGEVSRGVLFPKHRADLVHSSVAAERMVAGLIEELTVPSNPLDILAQQTIAACALDTLDVEEWFDLVRRSAPFAALPRSAFDATLDLLAGRYPSDQFAELRPRIVWDREAGTITGRPGAQRLAVTSGGTIPDRGLFGVYMVGEAGPGRRVGELDEEMVYESRVGDVFALGATSWRIQEITHDRVVVSPAFGEPGRLPFWKGDGIGRPAELGRAIGAFIRETLAADSSAAAQRLAAIGLDTNAAENLMTYLTEQRAATGRVPNDETLVIERFRDELGDWRVVLHSPYGMKVHAPWALAIGTRVRERFGVDANAVASDDGIVIRVPDTESTPPGADLFLFETDEILPIVTEQIGGSALFASRFRECAARALLLPRYNPGRRSPLWQQRQRASQLLDVARDYADFPIILETIRECFQDVYDVPALLDLTGRIASREVSVVEVETPLASPFASSLLFGYVGAFLYEGDSPLAERRAAALSIDPALLADLLGTVELREVLDPSVIETTESELQHLAENRRARGAEGIADLVRDLGPLTVEEIGLRVEPGTEVAEALADLARAKRVAEVGFAGRSWWIAVEDAARLRDALGVPVPPGVPAVFGEAVADPLGDLVGRYARTHGPFDASAVALRFGIGTAVALSALRRLASERRVVEGEFRPTGTGSEWCDAEVLRRLRRRSLAALRNEIEAVPPQSYARFLSSWQNIGGGLRGLDGVLSVVEQLEGVRLPASSWETLVLPARVSDYRPALLDELTATGDVLWAGAGGMAGNDGWVSLHLADSAALSLPIGADASDLSDLQREIVAQLGTGAGYFFRQLADAVGVDGDDELVDALWDLVWRGTITNDTLAPLRALLSGGSTTHRQAPVTPRARPGRPGRPSRAGARAQLLARTGPPTVGGRWSILPLASTDATARAAALGETLLDRYGVVTRGSAVAESIIGGFALVYRTLGGFEESGRARRGYFVEGLGGAQFGAPGAVDRLRAPAKPQAVALAATDPANPFGAALPWPAVPGEGTHRPGRKAGALVALVDGELVLYLERGGRSALVFSDDGEVLERAAAALAALVRLDGIGMLRVETSNGDFVIGSALGAALRANDFRETPKGLRISARG
ncbi:ATP-dependent helicase [Agromyces atrinae]|uniref:ATP-dependent Lhr-like helicase n=1 Tax=Agromyces atrinae TaxID=592376 RepID=A0A4Q2M736_9MICO|nr:ATP-dependent helicase [Agromyces atrinae]NYD66448.1 ATP-dependent Lhr-like helicase [Agromyces atrinae]RXZ87127.1 ATP-dependent helicase [Agromyces atrinae]